VSLLSPRASWAKQLKNAIFPLAFRRIDSRQLGHLGRAAYNYVGLLPLDGLLLIEISLAILHVRCVLDLLIKTRSECSLVTGAIPLKASIYSQLLRDGLRIYVARSRLLI
jgi:hypothetical protein